jgi:hypothetical protein
MRRIMRHIPEDELHSYLDQALSRIQCVEIESHLARCGHCRDARDGIAALRDRTTALLATLAPERTRIPPSWESLTRGAEAQPSRRSRVRYVAVWAASVLGALGAGWGAQSLLQTRQPSASVAGAPTTQPVQHAIVPPAGERPTTTRGSVAPDSSDSTPERHASRSTPVRQVAFVEEPPALDPTPADSGSMPSEPVASRLSAGRLPADFDIVAGGMWRTLSWDNAQRERGEAVPRILGLPVMEVQVAASRDSSGKPTMIVAQQLRSGEVIRTIEGPATDVTRLLAAQHGDAGSPWPTVPDSLGLSDGTMAMRRGDRILAIQASPSVPPDSLRAMIRRLNAADR